MRPRACPGRRAGHLAGLAADDVPRLRPADSAGGATAVGRARPSKRTAWRRARARTRTRLPGPIVVKSSQLVTICRIRRVCGHILWRHACIPERNSLGRSGLSATDPVLQRLAAEHGLRTDNVQAFREFVERRKLALPASLVNVIEPPGDEVLERIIQDIEGRYRAAGSG